MGENDFATLRLAWFPDPAWITGYGGLDHSHFPFRLQGREGPPLHVLMIEDDPAIAEMYRLQFLGVSAMSGSAPDVVLLDLLLPDRSGFEVLTVLNERFPNHPPVVILSNYGEPSMIDKGMSLGAVEYLVKSRVTPAEISGQIPLWVERGRRGGKADS